MWRVLIADDEPKIRQGLRKTLESFSFPLEIAAEAKNGLDAYKKAKELQPDILLVDICMPKLNGIDFLRKLKELRLENRIIIISGFQEFSYAQQAIELGVSRYLLKPFEDKDLRDALVQIMGELEESKHSGDVMRRLHQIQTNQEPRISVIRDWLNGNPDDEASGGSQRYTKEIAAVLPASRQESRNVPDEGETQKHEIHIPSEAAIVLIARQEILPDRFQDMDLQEERRAEILSILRPFEVLTVFYGRNREMTAVLGVLPADIQQLWRQLRSCMERSNQGKFCVQIRTCTRAGAPDVYAQMRKEARKVLECRPIVADARKYVYEHFRDSRLDLPEAAEAVGSNPSYLSRIMKQELGMSFKDFVTNLRITYAINLMHTTDLSINQIADRAGYSNQHYFSAAFKNAQGISPSDYRRGGIQ